MGDGLVSDGRGFRPYWPASLGVGTGKSTAVDGIGTTLVLVQRVPEREQFAVDARESGNITLLYASPGCV
jgi:hypothetical protein